MGSKFWPKNKNFGRYDDVTFITKKFFFDKKEPTLMAYKLQLLYYQFIIKIKEQAVVWEHN